MSFVKKNKGTYTGQSQTKVSQQEAELKAIIIYKAQYVRFIMEFQSQKNS